MKTSNFYTRLDVALKCCLECAETKPSNDFFPSRYRPDGHTDRCKKCVFNESKRRAARSDGTDGRRRAIEAGATHV